MDAVDPAMTPPSATADPARSIDDRAGDPPRGGTGADTGSRPASRRGRRAAPRRPDTPAPLLLVRVAVVAALAGLLVLTAWASPIALIAAFAWATLGLGWGWPAVFDLPAGRRLAAVTIGTGLLVGAAILLAPIDVPLGLVPVALAAGIVATFLLQLIRSDGRAGLTHEVVATAGALALVGLGAGLAPMGLLAQGPGALSVAMAGVAVSLVADLVSLRLGPSAWATLLTAALGALAGGLVGAALGFPTWWHGVVVGAVAAVLSYAVRRVLEAHAPGVGWAGQVASACASVLAVGALTQVLARLVVGA